jgi:hypothetical protein
LTDFSRLAQYKIPQWAFVDTLLQIHVLNESHVPWDVLVSELVNWLVIYMMNHLLSLFYSSLLFLIEIISTLCTAPPFHFSFEQILPYAFVGISLVTFNDLSIHDIFHYNSAILN